MGHIKDENHLTYIESYDKYMRQLYDPNDFKRNEEMFEEEYITASNYQPQIPGSNRQDNQIHSSLTEEDFERLGIERVDTDAEDQQTGSTPCDTKDGNG